MMDQPTFADVDYTSKKPQDPQRAISRPHGWADPLGHSPTSAAHGCSGVVTGVGNPLLWPTVA